MRLVNNMRFKWTNLNLEPEFATNLPSFQQGDLEENLAKRIQASSSYAQDLLSISVSLENIYLADWTSFSQPNPSCPEFHEFLIDPRSYTYSDNTKTIWLWES